MERDCSDMMVTPPASLRSARFLAGVIGHELLVQLFPANPHFLLRDGVQDSTAKIEPFHSETFRTAIPMNEGLVQAHESLYSLILIESGDRECLPGRKQYAHCITHGPSLTSRTGWKHTRGSAAGSLFTFVHFGFWVGLPCDSRRTPRVILAPSVL